MSPVIRNASRTELDLLIDWAAEEGRNPGLDDAQAFWTADPDGYFVAGGESPPVASLSRVRFGEDFAFLGFAMARPEHEDAGMALWHSVVALEDRRTLGIDAMPAQETICRRFGFAIAHTNTRYGGPVTCSEPQAGEVVSVAPLHMAMLIDDDRRFNPARRENFLREWLKQTPTRQSFALLRGTAIAGFGTIRQCRDGHRIGPLFCDTDTGADLLFRKLVAAVGGGMIFLDIPAPNAGARALCERYNLKPVFETLRMYRGLRPDLPLPRIYGITTSELG